MEASLNYQENKNPSQVSSPISQTGRNLTGVNSTPATMAVTRCEPNNPYPTTFVQADTNSFKQVVQMLTGTAETAKLAATGGSTRPDPIRNPIPLIKSGTTKKEKASKLYERRNSLQNIKITPMVRGFENYSGSPRGAPEILSPSMLKFPGLVLSPVTPLIPDPFNRSPHTTNVGSIDMEAENKAIAHKGFYLHPSPTNTPRGGSEPRLLPLFPVTSPRVSGSSSSQSS